VRVHLLYNPKAGAGRAEAAARAIVAPLEQAGHEPALGASRLEPSEGWLDPALRDADVLVVIGGDGAMRLAAASAARTETPAYHYPLGTENLFSREFAMRATPAALLAAIRAHRVEHADIGVANGRLFLLMASVGYDAEVIDDLSARRTGGITHLAYAGPLLRQLARWDPAILTVTADGEVLCEDRPGVAIVANSRQYARRIDPARRASMTDQQLDVVVFPTPTRRALVSWLLSCLRGRHLDDPRLVYRTATQIEVRTPAPRHYQLDGDPPEPPAGTEKPDVTNLLRISLWNKRLPVLVP
jgi:diacylglycerol kinase family enzyme